MDSERYFHHFPNLPPELRLHIWELALAADRRTRVFGMGLHLTDYEAPSSKIKTTAQHPPIKRGRVCHSFWSLPPPIQLTWVCHESRTVCFKDGGVLAFQAPQYPKDATAEGPGLYFRPAHDVVMLKTTDVQSLRWRSPQGFAGGNFTQVRTIAVPLRELTPGDLVMPSFPAKRAICFIRDLLQVAPNLQCLILAIHARTHDLKGDPACAPDVAGCKRQQKVVIGSKEPLLGTDWVSYGKAMAARVMESTVVQEARQRNSRFEVVGRFYNKLM